MSIKIHSHIKVAGLLISIFLFSCEKVLPNIEITDQKHNAMILGVKLTAPTPQPEKYFDDLLHPCVRYIPDGFAGHNWWMVASPDRNADSSIENPILYFGDSREGDLPPLLWTALGVIEETPIKGGYNSDPNLYFDGNGLWIFWRENGTAACFANAAIRATFGKYTLDGITFSPKKFFAGEKTGTEDSEMCPIVLKINDKVKLFGAHHQFTPERAPWGLSIWDIADNDLQNNVFTKTIDVLPSYKSGFDFWHFDLFIHDNKYYCVVSPESGNEILLGRSDDGVNFKFWNTPLLSNDITGRSFFYKPSAMVYKGIFYLWNPVAELGVSPRTSRIWMSEIVFDDLISILDSYDNFTNTDTILFKNEKVTISRTLNGITLDNIESPTNVWIYNINGALIFESRIKTKTAFVNLAKGLYIVKTDLNRTKIIVN